MQLKYKISFSIFIISLIVFSSISFFYSKWSYQAVIDIEKNKLKENAVESAKYIEHELIKAVYLLHKRSFPWYEQFSTNHDAHCCCSKTHKILMFL